jgi:hypothetical protein
MWRATVAWYERVLGMRRETFGANLIEVASYSG